MRWNLLECLSFLFIIIIIEFLSYLSGVDSFVPHFHLIVFKAIFSAIPQSSMSFLSTFPIFIGIPFFLAPLILTLQYFVRG